MKKNITQRVLTTIFAALAISLQALAIGSPSIDYNETTKVVTMSHGDASATIYYTVDGTTPTTDSYRYTAALAITRNLQLRAIAVKGSEVSSVSSRDVNVESRFLKEGIYYRLRANTLANEVEVAPRESGSYTGDITIPTTVTYGGTTYTVTRIGQDAFYDQDNVTSVTIPSTVNIIGYQAFYGMERLTAIDIPGSVKTIGAWAFGSSRLTLVTLHEGLEAIDYSAFRDNTSLTAITLPGTLKSIGYEAFYNCSQLTSISIPDAVETIGYGVFRSCSRLTSVKLPAALPAIEHNTFQYCYALRSIDIPATVQTIGDEAFSHCDALTSITLPVGVQTLGRNVFFNCDNLLSATLPEGLTTVPYGAFDDCYVLATVSLPSTLTTIDERAFNTCRSLTSITIPENVSSISANAFTECTALTNVYCLPTTPPTMSTASGGNAFYDCLERVTLYVKSAAMNNYTSSTLGWDSFEHKQAIDNLLCEQPTFELANYVLTISTTTDGATIHYTTDGSEPTTASATYTGPIPFWQNDTIRAIAAKDGMDASPVSEFQKSTYTVSTPVTTMDEHFVVTIACEQPDIDGFPEAEIYYLLNTDYSNVSLSNSNWKRYDGPIQLEHPQYVHVYAKRDGWITSSQTYGNYYSDYNLSTPSVEWNSTTKKAYIYNYNSNFPNATLHYTLDGSDPTTDSPVYNHEDSVAIVRNVVMKVMAVQEGKFNSYLGTRTFTGLNGTFYVGGLYYRLVDNVLTDEVEVTAPSNSNSPYTGDIVVPDHVTYGNKTYTVARIGDNAFYGQGKVTSVSLPSTITSIGTQAFYDMSQLTAIDIPASVKTIGAQAFRSTPLTQVTLHEGLESIGSDAFAYNPFTVIILPNTLTSIGEEAFYSCNKLTAISIPDAVQAIGQAAFRGCTSLTSVKLPATLSAIGDQTFQDCTALRSIDIPATVQAIGYSAFRNCDGLTTITLPVGVTTLGTYIFHDCDKLLSVTIPEGVTIIPKYAFYDCDALTTVSLPSTLTSIGEGGFHNCNKLATITIPENVTTIGAYAFTRCSALTSIYSLAATPASIDGENTTHAFADATTRTTLYVKPAAESIYRTTARWNEFTHVQTFDNFLCAQPTFELANYVLTISTTTDGATIHYTTDGSEPTTASATYTGPIPFWQNDTIRAIAVKDGMDASLVSEFQKSTYTVSTPVTTMDEHFVVTIACEQPDIDGFPEAEIYYLMNTSSYNIDLNDSNWKRYDGPIQLEHPQYVHVYAKRDGWITSSQTYGNYYSDYNLSTPSVEWNSTTKKAYIYNYNSNFPNATLHYTLDGSDPTTDSPVYNHEDSVAIVRNVVMKVMAVQEGKFNSYLGSRTFTGMNATFLKDGIYYRLVDNVLTNEVEVTKGSKAYTGAIVVPATIKYDGVDYTVTRIGDNAFSSQNNVTSVSLPSTITSIGTQAFYDMSQLTAIDIPASVKTIGAQAFRSTPLTQVTLHEGLESIGSDAFAYNPFTAIILPNTLTSIGEEAFYSCNKLTAISIPDAVQAIGQAAFRGCTSLTSVKLPATLSAIEYGTFQDCTSLRSIDIPATVQTIGNSAFQNCDGLTTITLPVGVKTLGTSIFYDCDKLLSVVIPEGVTTLPADAFSKCDALTTVSLPTTLTIIGEDAFYQCPALPSITIPENVTRIDPYAFAGCTALSSVYCLAATPPTVSGDGTTNAFANVQGNDHIDVTLYTKTATKETYDNTAPWDNFSASVAIDNLLAAQPTFLLSNYKLAMTTSTPGATLYYTRDNSEPTTESTKYTAPIALLTNDTIRAIAVADGYAPSVVGEFRKNDYKVGTPTASLSDDLTLTLDCETLDLEGIPDTRIYYKENTRDSYWEYESWKRYEGPIQMTQPRYIRVMAQRDGWLDSDQSSTYNYYTNYSLDAPTMTWTKDGTTGIGTMTLSYYSSSEGDFYYTLDGTTPSKENGTLYTEPFEVNRNLTVKAVAVKDVHFNSNISSYDVTNVSRTFYVDKIFYRLTDNSLANEVEVTNGNIAYEGEVTIPASVDINGEKYDVVGIGASAFYQQANLTAVNMAPSIRHIGTQAFYDCDKLTSVGFSPNLTSIGERAFWDCDYLPEIDVPASVKSIGASAFDNCDRLATVTLHEGLETIGDLAFWGAYALKTIVLPSTVTSIGASAFKYCTSLTSATLPAGLTTLSTDLFRYDQQLTHIVLPTAPTSIGDYAFAETGITTLEIPASVTTIGTAAFGTCRQLTHIVIPEGITELKANTFDHSLMLASVSLPSTLQRIGSQCFYDCPLLATITLPANVQSIGAGAFASCPKLLTVYSQATTPGTLEGDAGNSYSYDRDPFNGTKLQATLYVPETAVTAYTSATAKYWNEFGNIVGSNLLPCEEPTFKLADYKLTIQSLTDGASIYYTNDGSTPDVNAIPYTAPFPLTQNDTIRAVAVKEGLSLSSIGEFRKNDYKAATPTATLSEDLTLTITCETPDAEGMPDTRIYYKENTRDSYWDYESWKLYEGPFQMTQPRYIRLMAERDGWIASNQSSTYNYYTNYRLAKPSIKWDSTNEQFTITTSDADVKIYYTLDGTTPTEESNLYTKPVSLMRNLQVKAVAMEDKHFNSEVDSLQVTGVDHKFAYDKLYYRLVDNSTANEVELVPYEGVTYEGDIVVPATVQNAGNTYTVVGIAASSFYDANNLTSISLPSTLRYINESAFYDCDNLTQIEIPAGVKTLARSVLASCGKLQTVVLHEGLEEIGESAFYNDQALANINFPATLTKIGQQAFYRDKELKRLDLPDAVQTIGEGAFWYCYGVESIKLPAGLTEIAPYTFAETGIMSIDIPAAVKKIGQAAFGTCKSLRSVAIPEGVTAIADNTFDYCYALTTVELPSTLTTIGYRAFYEDSNLENLILPASLTAIGSQAFTNCATIESIYSLATEPPTAEDLSLAACAGTATLYVPVGTKDDYAANPLWSRFTIETFTDLPCAQPIFAYENYKLSMSSKTEGVSIYYTRDGSAPTTRSLKYDAPIDLLQNDTIRAMAIGEGWGQSPVSEFRKADYQVATPEATLSSDFTVSLTCETPDVLGMPETKIYYSMNRSSYDPGESWTLYTEPFKMYQANYIHVKALREGWNDSETIHENYYSNYFLSAPSISPTYTDISYMPADTTITLSHNQDDVQLYYTLDGSDPNLEGVLYTGPIKPEHNVKVTVVAKREGAINSDPATKEYKWFTVAKPQISIEHLSAVIASEKPADVTYYYTLDGTTPTRESKRYEGPVALTEDCYISAIAVAENWNDSPVGSYNNGSKYLTSDLTVKTPVLSPTRSGEMTENGDSILRLSSATTGATLYYTLDGTTPTERSQRYEGGIKLTENCTVKAVAVKEDMYDSAIDSATVSWFQVEQPKIAFNGKYVSITTDTEDAFIYYTIDNTTPTVRSTAYQGTFDLDDSQNQVTVRALAVKENWNNSNASQLTYYTNNNYCEDPTIARVSGTNKVQMSTGTTADGTVICYTTDGMTPTANDLVYDGAIEVTENMTIRAITTNPIYYNSAVSTFEVNWFKVAQPTINTDGRMVSVTCEKEDARIYYTTDGTEPTEYSTQYVGAFKVDGDCVIQAIAMFDNFHDSNIARYTYSSRSKDHACTAPTFSRNDNVITLTTSGDENTSIHYTTDGSTPTAQSAIYTEPIEVAENMTIKAIASNPNLFDSDESTMAVNWFQTEEPTITTNGINISMACATPDAQIYYTLDGTAPSAESLRYLQPITMTGTANIRAIAIRTNFNNSPVATLYFDQELNRSGTPTFQRNGNSVTLSATIAENTRIYYTTDGTEPTSLSTLYEAPIQVDENQTLKAITVSDNLFDSKVVSYSVNWFKVNAPSLTFDGIFLTIACETPNARIHYTLDGKQPTEESPLYSGVLTMTESCTVKAIAVKENFNNSDVMTHMFYQAANMVETPVISRSSNTVKLTTATTDDGTAIFYTTDGTEPTAYSTPYTAPFEVTENMTVKAIATSPKLFASTVATFEVDWFKVEAPVMTFDGFLLILACETPGSRIYYTTDGTTPTEESLRYTDVLTMNESCTVKAIAVKENFNNSAVVTQLFDRAVNVVATPTLTREGNTVKMATTTTQEGTVIYYTTDGSEPTAESARYTTPIETTENMTVKAIAMNDKLFPSGTATFEVDWFKVEAPVISMDGKTVTITCETPGAIIYYALGEEPTTASAIYGQPIQLVDNREVRAFAVKRNFKDSETVATAPDLFVCEDVTFAYNGRYLTMQTGEGMTIRYTTDGSRPTAESATYTAPVDIDELCTVTAIAQRADFRDSQATTYKVTYLYDGEEASLDEPGHLEEMFAWSGGTTSVETLPVKGSLNTKDLLFIRSIPSLRHLDLSQARFEDDRIPDGAFANMPLISFISPTQVSEVGKNLFKGCNDLAAIVWSANITLPMEAIEDVKNPNLLLYVNSHVYVPTGYTGNLISGGQAVSITLADTETGGNFYCPQQFYTQQISYTHNYTQPTETGAMRGWETLSLPFDVQTITHEKRGAMAPFAKGEDITQYRPFWLYELKSTGFERAADIKAYTPYIVSMPNNPNYADDYILAGKVTFASQNIYVEKDEPNVSMKGSVRFTPAMQRQKASENVLVINLEDYTDADGAFYVNGSAFLPNMREAHPFEACAQVNASTAKELDHVAGALTLEEFLWGSVTDLQQVETEQLEKLGEKRGIYDLSGRHLGDDSSKLKQENGQHRRIYIINGKKQLMK